MATLHRQTDIQTDSRIPPTVAQAFGQWYRRYVHGLDEDMKRLWMQKDDFTNKVCQQWRSVPECSIGVPYAQSNNWLYYKWKEYERDHFVN